MNYLTFGEMLLRLSAVDHEKLFQSSNLEGTFVGSEGNVAVSLAMLGENVKYLSVLPENHLGDSCQRELRKYGVDTSLIQRGKGRMGLYYLEQGAGFRPSSLIYDRENSSMALADRGDIDWESVLEDVHWLHISGITPGISQSAKRLTLEAATVAKKLNKYVSFDINYRGQLWNYGEKASDVLNEIMKKSDLVIGSRAEYETCFSDALTTGYGDEDDRNKICEIISKDIMNKYNNLDKVAIIDQVNYSADWNEISSTLYDGTNMVVSKKFDIRNIVDRVGMGDAFTAGLLYGINSLESEKEAVDFAISACCIKSTIEGDFNISTLDEILDIMKGETSGNPKR